MLLAARPELVSAGEGLCHPEEPPPLPQRVEPPLPNALLQIQIVDGQGQPLRARATVRGPQGQAIPGVADTTLHTHHGGSWMGEYFYVDGSAGVSVPLGNCTVTAAHGFEWRPLSVTANVQHDTTLVLTLERLFDLRAEGWYSGDTHTHTTHNPIQMVCTPRHYERIAQAEDLGIAWALDGATEFTGGPHVRSTPETILYFTTEYRNQAYGHTALLGLTDMSLGTGCCNASSAAYPTLTMLRAQWNPTVSQAMILAHPRTTTDFFFDDGWPGAGLGRELPVMATEGALDAVDLASYSIVGDTCATDWHGLLSCGRLVSPSTGTDAVMNWYYQRPIGAYRVYVREDGPHTADSWVQALRAGRSFVTNYPLIPTFTVEGAEAGSRIDRTGPTTTVHVDIRVQSALPPSRIRLLRNGGIARSWTIANPQATEWVVSGDITISQSSWFTVRVEGTTTSRQAVSSVLYAETGAVIVRLDGEEPRSTAWAGRFIDWVDSLETFVELRGQWPNQTAHSAVLAQLDSSRAAYALAFRTAPGGFNLLLPADGDTLNSTEPMHFEWTPALDPEIGDRLAYYLEFSPDSAFPRPDRHGPIHPASYELPPAEAPPGESSYWRVVAVDRGGNSTVSVPAFRRAWFVDGPSSVATTAPPGIRLQAQPNPSGGAIRLLLDDRSAASGEGAASVGASEVLEVFDTGGRRLRRIAGQADETRHWDGRDDFGRLVPAGSYYLRLSRHAGEGARPLRVGTTGVLILR